MSSVAVVVPVLGRPERPAEVAWSLYAAEREVETNLVFVVSPDDAEEADAIEALHPDYPHVVRLFADWEPGPADWARKINLAYRNTDDPWIFTGADDLCFCPGWADRALECAAATGAQVIGTNDLGNPRVTRGGHATHNLVSRAYADARGTIDGPGAVVSEAYDHNFVDDELVETARRRRAWTFCAASEVPHLHPNWGDTTWDETYEKGQRHFDADRRVFAGRRRRILSAR